MVDPPTLSISCAFTRTTPFLDGILTSLLCPSMNTLLWVMNSIPKMQSIPLRWKPTNPPFLSNSLIEEAHFLLAMWWDEKSHPQSAPQWVPWTTPIGAPFFRHFFRLSSYGKPMSKRHNTSRLETIPFKKIRRLYSPWSKLAVRAITLEFPFFSLGLG